MSGRIRAARIVGMSMILLGMFCALFWIWTPFDVAMLILGGSALVAVAEGLRR